MNPRIAHGCILIVSTVLLVGAPTLADGPAPATCAPNGATCTVVSSGYANGSPGVCVAGACTYCKAVACSTACAGLSGMAQSTCTHTVVQAQIAASERDRVADAEKRELVGLLKTLIRETETADCPRGVALGTNNCGQHWVRGLSDAELDGATGVVQRQIDRVVALQADLHLATDPTFAKQVTDTSDLVAKEKTCRATPACMDARRAAALQDEMCSLVIEIHNMQERIRIERANPSGVVDLRELHDDGEVIQNDQAALAAKKPEFLKVAHKPFSEASCK